MWFYNFRVRFTRKFVRVWYFLMKPVAKFVDLVDRKLDERMDRNLTEEKAVKVVAKNLAKDIIKGTGKRHLIKADGVYEEDYRSYSFDSGLRFNYRLQKSRKSKKSFRMLDMSDKRIQESIIEEVRNIRGFSVTEEVWEFHRWDRIEGYEYTYKIEYMG